MLVTDGATEMYDDVFEKYNWPERKVCPPPRSQFFNAMCCQHMLERKTQFSWGIFKQEKSTSEHQE